jgi:hypothetical protein
MVGHHKWHELLQLTGHNNKHAVIYGNELYLYHHARSLVYAKGMAHVTPPLPNLNVCDLYLWEYTWMLEDSICSSYCKIRQVTWPYRKYCGVAPRERSIERPLLINDYAYLAVSLPDNGPVDSNS